MQKESINDDEIRASAPAQQNSPQIIVEGQIENKGLNPFFNNLQDPSIDRLEIDLRDDLRPDKPFHHAQIVNSPNVALKQKRASFPVPKSTVLLHYSGHLFNTASTEKTVSLLSQNKQQHSNISLVPTTPKSSKDGNVYQPSIRKISDEISYTSKQSTTSLVKKYLDSSQNTMTKELSSPSLQLQNTSIEANQQNMARDNVKTAHPQLIALETGKNSSNKCCILI